MEIAFRAQAPIPSLASRPREPAGTDKNLADKLIDELSNGEMLDLGIHLSPAHMIGIADGARNFGRSVAGAWKDLRKTVDRILDLPFVDERVSQAGEERIASVVVDVARGLGYGAAGISALSGVVKLTHSKSSKVKKLEGLMDIATAGVIATTVAGLAIAPAVLIPVVAAMGVVKGAMIFKDGFDKGDFRREVQGLLGGTRSAGTVSRRLGKALSNWSRVSSVLAVTGSVLGAAAGAIQVVRGFTDVSKGLKEKYNAKELQGLTDIGMATGLLLTATGLGALPGVILTTVCGALRVGYAVSKKFRARVDPLLDRCEPAMAKVVAGVEKVAAPVLKVARKILSHFIGPPAGGTEGGSPGDAKRNE